MAAKWQLEVLTAESGQFLVGDNPAVTVRTDATPLPYNMAFGDAHSIVLPIGALHGYGRFSTGAEGTEEAVDAQAVAFPCVALVQVSALSSAYSS